MSKIQIEEAIKSLGEIPSNCQRQIDIQRNNFLALITQMEEYDWTQLFDTGVKILEKHGDPQQFMSKLLVPVKISVYIPDKEDPSGNKVTVKARTLPSILETKLKSMDIYLGPISQKLQTSNKEEIVNPFRIVVSKESRIARLTVQM